MSDSLFTFYLVGSATVIGGLKVRAVSVISDLVAGPGEIVTTVRGTMDQFAVTVADLAAGRPCYL